MLIRREPFRLLFLLGALIGLCGVLPWLLFGTGLERLWPGERHALTMTQGFVVAIAAGFLGTMIPRRTGGAPLSTVELALIVGGLMIATPALLFGHLLIGEASHLLVLVTLVEVALRRLVKSQRPALPSFVLIPIALGSAIAGVLFLGAFALGAPGWTDAAGRALVERGFLLPLVLAVAPMLTPLIAHDKPPDESGHPQARLQLAAHAAAGLAVVAGVLIERLLSARIGLLLAGAASAVELAFAGVLRPPSAPGLHRRLYRLALWMVPIGLLAAGARPAWRVPFLHLTYIGGIALLVFAVSMHVTVLHTGHEAQASRSPWPVALVGGLFLAAMTVRVSAERFVSAYPQTLALAAALWLGGTMTWLLYLAPMMFARGHE